jgi:hypothetical protein
VPDRSAGKKNKNNKNKKQEEKQKKQKLARKLLQSVPSPKNKSECSN